MPELHIQLNTSCVALPEKVKDAPFAGLTLSKHAASRMSASSDVDQSYPAASSPHASIGSTSLCYESARQEAHTCVVPSASPSRVPEFVLTVPGEKEGR